MSDRCPAGFQRVWKNGDRLELAELVVHMLQILSDPFQDCQEMGIEERRVLLWGVAQVQLKQ